MKALFSPSQVEQELRMLQRELSPSEARASLFNLVIFSREGLANPSDKALAHLLGKRAARIIQIQSTRATESTMSVTARCFPDRENRGVCFQEVMIQNGHDNAGVAPGTWAPLLIRDIPVYVLWYDKLLTNREYLVQIRDQVDKIVFDSRWNESTGESPEAICAVIAQDFVAKGFLVSDLAWKRGLALRRITATLFDGDEGVAKLSQISSLELTSESESEAHLYALWLASRLDWHWAGRSARNGGTTWQAVDRQGRHVEVHFEQCEGSGDENADGETTVRMMTSGDEEILVNGTPGGCVDTVVPGQEGQRHLFLSPATGQMLLEEVDSLRSDYLYSDAVLLSTPDVKHRSPARDDADIG